MNGFENLEQKLKNYQFINKLIFYLTNKEQFNVLLFKKSKILLHTTCLETSLQNLDKLKPQIHGPEYQPLDFIEF